MTSKASSSARIRLLTLQWRLTLFLMRIGRARLVLLALAIVLFIWHFVAQLPQIEALQSNLNSLQLAAPSRHVLKKPKPALPYGAHYQQILAVFKQHALSVDHLAFSQSSGSGAPVYSLDLTTSGDYTTLYQALGELQKKTETRVIRLRLERDSPSSSQIRAQLRLSFTVKP